MRLFTSSAVSGPVLPWRTYARRLVLAGIALAPLYSGCDFKPVAWAKVQVPIVIELFKQGKLLLLKFLPRVEEKLPIVFHTVLIVL